MALNKRLPVYILVAATIAIVGYTVILFFYLEIFGVFTIARIVKGIPTSEGVDYYYEFNYAGGVYNGSFTDMKGYKIGTKFFVCFSKDNPSHNLLKFTKPVPDCLKDSVFTYWQNIPHCK